MAITKIKKKLHIPTNWWNNETNWKISLYGLWSFRSVPKIVERKVLSLILHSPVVVTFSRISHSFYGKVRFFGFTSPPSIFTKEWKNWTLCQFYTGPGHVWCKRYISMLMGLRLDLNINIIPCTIFLILPRLFCSS